MTVTHLDLFSGIGGFALAAQWAGMQTIGFVEIDKYCQRVLAKNFPATPLLADDIHDFDATTLRNSVNIVTGGFPCQPFSLAGLRRGNADDRAIWPQMLRVVSECRPGWVVGENVAGIIDLALDDVLTSLESESYEAWTVVFPACAVGALHIRQRVFVVAHDSNAEHGNCKRRRERERSGASDQEREAQKRRVDSLAFERLCEAVPNADSKRLKERDAAGGSDGAQFARWQVDARGSQWKSEPAIRRVVDGLSRGLDIRPRLHALGNAVVPQQVYPLLDGIATIERSEVQL